MDWKNCVLNSIHISVRYQWNFAKRYSAMTEHRRLSSVVALYLTLPYPRNNLKHVPAVSNTLTYTIRNARYYPITTQLSVFSMSSYSIILDDLFSQWMSWTLITRSVMDDMTTPVVLLPQARTSPLKLI